jgi:hypothetical protein
MSSLIVLTHAKLSKARKSKSLRFQSSGVATVAPVMKPQSPKTNPFGNVAMNRQLDGWSKNLTEDIFCLGDSRFLFFSTWNGSRSVGGNLERRNLPTVTQMNLEQGWLATGNDPQVHTTLPPQLPSPLSIPEPSIPTTLASLKSRSHPQTPPLSCLLECR